MNLIFKISLFFSFNYGNVTSGTPWRPSQNRHLPVSSTCSLSVVENFSQRINLFKEVRQCRKERKTVKQDKIITLQPLNKVKDL